MSAKIPCGKLLTFAGAASIMRFRRSPCGFGGKQGADLWSDGALCFFYLPGSSMIPSRMPSVRFLPVRLQYSSRTASVLSSRRTWRGLDFGFSAFGRPVRGLKLFTSLYVAHKLIIIYVAQNVKRIFLFKKKPRTANAVRGFCVNRSTFHHL